MKAQARNKSILQKFIIPILVIMFAQTVLFACIFLFGGTITRLNDNSFDILTERTSSRRNHLQNEMIQKWSNLGQAETEINATIDAILAAHALTPENINTETSSQILNAVSGDIISLLRDNSVTDAFIILNSDTETKQGLYLRDLDPTTNSADNADIQIEHAPPSVTKQLGISLSSSWSPNLQLSVGGENSKFYYMPFDAALQYPDAQSSNLGYWSLPFVPSNGSAQSVVTYTIPLRTSEGAVYGVLGTGVTMDYLASDLPYEEININKKGVYILGVMHGDSTEITDVVTSGPMSNMISGSSGTTTVAADPYREGIYTILGDSRAKNSVYANIQPLRLYNTNTPFENDQWVLSGMIESKYLLDSSYHVMTMVLISFAVSIAFGIISAIIVGRRLTSPITALVHTLRSSSAETELALQKTHIIEIDRLADAVQALNQDVEKTASRFSQIIHAADVSIGAYEYNAAANRVVFSGDFFSMLDLPERAHMSGEEFTALMKGLMKNTETQSDADTFVIKFIKKNNDVRWLRLKSTDKDSMSFGVLTDVTREIAEKRKIEYERDYDPLTNLLNRRAFHAKMKEIYRKPDQLKIAAFMMWDLDNLKYINDTYGHDYGDKYIIAAANVLRHFSKLQNAVVSRVSGDEFYVFLYGYESKDSARAVIHSVREEMNSASMLLPDSRQTKIGASAGVAWYPDDATNYSILIKYADFSMYTAKRTEKGQLFEYNSELYERDSFLLNSKEELDQLIDDESLDYVFQPIVNAHTGDIFGYEALMRPDSSSHLQEPAAVLRVAEIQSRLQQIEKLTLFNAARSFSKFSEITGDKKLFINTLPGHMLFGDDITAFETEFHDILDRFVFELIETDRLNDTLTRRKLEYCKTWGAQIAIDDYGTGYSNESILLSLNPDYVKIDIALVHNINADPNRQLLLKNLLAYLRSQNIAVIAEGVENAEEMRLLITYGIDYLQGYYLGAPESVPAFSSARAEEIRSCQP